MLKAHTSTVKCTEMDLASFVLYNYMSMWPVTQVSFLWTQFVIKSNESSCISYVRLGLKV